MSITLINILSILLMLCIIPTAWLIYKKKITFFNGVFFGTFLFLVSFGCSVLSVYMQSGQSPLDYIVNSVFDDISSTVRSVNGVPAAEIEAINNMLEQFKGVFLILLPSFIVISNLFWAYVLLMAEKGILALFRRDVSGFARFCDFQMPKMGIFLAVVSYVLSAVLEDSKLGYAFANFGTILFVVCAVCGLSAIDYAFRKKLRISIVRAIIYICGIFTVSVITGAGGTILVLAGILDSFFDFRKFRRK